MLLENFKQYEPTDELVLKIREVLPDVKFIRSTDGKDWYDVQKQFSTGTLKIKFEPSTGIIKAIHRDGTGMWPEGYSVAEIDDIPSIKNDDLNIIDLMTFDVSTMSITPRVYTNTELVKMAQSKMQYLRNSAMTEINSLVFAQELSIISDKETNYLNNLKLYVVELTRLGEQPGYPSNIAWPVMPSK